MNPRPYIVLLSLKPRLFTQSHFGHKPKKMENFTNRGKGTIQRAINMNNAIRLTRTYPPTLLSVPLPQQRASGIRFRKITSMSTQPESKQNRDEVQKGLNPNQKTGDVMSHSFGDGYATRSDEEGFGGIYGENQSFQKPEKDEPIHENHPAYDKTQGSEVKEKEKARHQTNANS
ncbi:hypothetical protein SO802_025402 [Lithocarpus litseifolius]|uniref:Uncharacterized protein n=1 Tax=Lithocarpus litseifolius TaxID=425828 RepID=A0AAW2BX56_9ROSI